MTNFTIHPRRPEVTVGDKIVRLNWQRWQLLGYLYDHANTPVSVRQLGDLMGYDSDTYLWSEYAFQLVYQIRKTLRKAGCPNLIETVRHRGYRLVVPS